MEKGLLIFIAIGIGGIYLITDFLGDTTHKEGGKEQNIAYKYQSVGNIGQIILNVKGIDTATQVAVWNASILKEEFLDLFPDFIGMKEFVRERVKGDALQVKLLEHIESVEGQYFSGTLNTEEAKQALGLLK